MWSKCWKSSTIDVTARKSMDVLAVLAAVNPSVMVFLNFAYISDMEFLVLGILNNV